MEPNSACVRKIGTGTRARTKSSETTANGENRRIGRVCETGPPPSETRPVLNRTGIGPHSAPLRKRALVASTTARTRADDNGPTLGDFRHLRVRLESACSPAGSIHGTYISNTTIFNLHNIAYVVDSAKKTLTVRQPTFSKFDIVRQNQLIRRRLFSYHLYSTENTRSDDRKIYFYPNLPRHSSDSIQTRTRRTPLAYRCNSGDKIK